MLRREVKKSILFIDTYFYWLKYQTKYQPFRVERLLIGECRSAWDTALQLNLHGFLIIQYHFEHHEAYSCLGDISVISSEKERHWQPHHLGLLLWNLHWYLREKYMYPITPKGSFTSSAFFQRNFLFILCHNKPVVCKSHHFAVTHDWHIEINAFKGQTRRTWELYEQPIWTGDVFLQQWA